MKRSGDSWLVDGTILALALLGLGIVVRLILQPFSDARPTPAVTVALVVESANEVRRRPAAGFEWRPLESGDALAAGELVFVGAGSFVRLSLGNDTVLAIEENSLVRMPEVKETAAERALQLVKGSVDVQSQTQEVTVARGNTQLKLAGESRARLSAAGQGAEVELKAGGAMLGLGEALEAGTRTTLDAQGAKTAVARLSVKQVSPSDGDRLFATDTDPSATFAWQSTVNDCELVLKGREARRVRSATSSVNLSLEPGFYSWRVDCRTAQGNATSETRWLVVHQRKAPRLLAPRDGAVVDLSRAKELMLNWTRAPGAQRYTVSLESDEPGIPDDKRTADSVRPRTRLPVPSREGRYCSQVRAVYAEGPESPWSKRECFRLITSPVLKAPQLFQPKREKIEEPKKKDKGSWLWEVFVGGVAYAAEQDSAITLRWEQIAGARSYLIEIAEDRAFGHVVLKQKVDKPYFRWFKIARRNYFWRVRGLDESGREGVISDIKVIGVETEPPTPLGPLRRQAIYHETPEVELKWSAAEALVTFNVVVAKDPEFTQVVSRADGKRGRSTTVRLPSYGEYYWRVTGIDLEGQPTQPGPAGSFVISSGAPEPQLPRAQQRFVADSEVTIQWAKRAGVSSYELEIDGTRAVGNGNTTTVRLIPGTHTWRVRGKSPETAWSERRTFVVEAPLASAQSSTLPASVPASAPTTQPAVRETQPLVVTPPEATGGVRVLLGVRVGFFSNFGAVATVRPGVDVSARFLLGPGELGATIAGDYYPAGSRFVEAGYTVESNLSAFSVSAGATYALRFGRFRPYATLGAQVVPMTASTRVDGSTVSAATLVSYGGFLAPGCELAIGPGAAFFEVSVALGTRPRTPQLQVDGSGIFAALGYRFSLLSTGRLTP